MSNTAYLEYVARVASETLRVNPEAAPVGKVLLDMRFMRKHGPGKYYGQE